MAHKQWLVAKAVVTGTGAATEIYMYLNNSVNILILLSCEAKEKELGILGRKLKISLKFG